VLFHFFLPKKKQNRQVRVSQQQEITVQKTTLLNLLLSNALIQKDGEIARLHMELQRKQENLENARQLAVIALETNDSLLRRLPPVQQETNPHVSSNEVDAPGSEDEATSVLRTVCPLCNAVKGDAVETRFG
jgi:E3 ubiquitin-protein ligase BOI-like protein